MKPIHIIQVGLGSWGQSWIRDVLSAQDDVKVGAYVDRDADRLDAARVRLELPAARCTTSLEAALREVDAEAVLVTTALGTHVPVIQAALAAGKHVLTEKPFAARLTDAQALVTQAEAQDRVLMVSQNYRWFPAVRAVQALLQRRKVGRVLSVSLDFRKPPGSSPRQGPSRLLLDMAIHHMDLLRTVLGEELTYVWGWSVDPDWRSFSDETLASLPLAVFAHLRYGDAIPVSYRFSWMSHDAPTTWGGTWSIEGETGHLGWTSRGEGGVAQDAVTLRRAGEAPEVVVLPELSHVGRRGALHAFVDAVRSGAVPETSGRDNLRTLAAMEALIASVTSGGPVDLPAGWPCE